MSSANFLTLPPKLRNEIYELAFTLSTNSSTKLLIDLRDTPPPGKELLLVCRKIYNEAGKIYREAYHQYWKEGHFDLDLTKRPLDLQGRQDLLVFLDTELAHMRNLQITGSYKGPPRVGFRFTRVPGGWQSDRLQVGAVRSFLGFAYRGGELCLTVKYSAADLEAASKDSLESRSLGCGDFFFILEECLSGV